MLNESLQIKAPKPTNDESWTLTSKQAEALKAQNGGELPSNILFISDCSERVPSNMNGGAKSIGQRDLSAYEGQSPVSWLLALPKSGA